MFDRPTPTLAQQDEQSASVAEGASAFQRRGQDMQTGIWPLAGLRSGMVLLGLWGMRSVWNEMVAWTQRLFGRGGRMYAGFSAGSMKR